MRTTLFKWARENDMSMPNLAARLGYSERHLCRIRDGDWPVTKAFAGRVVLALGDWARSLFPSDVSTKLDSVPIIEEHGIPQAVSEERT